jgi:hypothetical protein
VAFTWYTVANVCARGLITKFLITADSGGDFDLEVHSADAGAGEVHLQALDVTAATYPMSVPWYYEADSGSSMYIGIKNKAGGSRTFTLTTLRLEKFA